MLARTPEINRDLRTALVELKRLLTQRTTGIALERLNQAFTHLKPTLRWVVPAQTVCNFWNYWFTFLPAAFDRDQVGWNFRQALTNAPPGRRRSARPATVNVPGEVETPIAGYSGLNANGKAGPILDPPSGGEFRPTELPILHAPPYCPSGQNGEEDCQTGQHGYLLGSSPEVRLPGQALEIPRSASPTCPARPARRRSSTTTTERAASRTRAWRAGSHEGRTSASGSRTGRSA